MRPVVSARASSLLPYPFRATLPILAERARVALHLAGAERAARSHEPPFERAKALLRALLLDELATYREAGQFPKNPGFPWPVPVFVDDGGTRCAVAHLMGLTGASELVAEIATTRNLAFVRELADDPRIGAWLEAAGLTVDEAAAIQPEYCSTASWCLCGEYSSASAGGLLEATVTRIDGSLGQATVTAMYGATQGHATGQTVQVRVFGGTVVGATLLMDPSRTLDEGADAGQSFVALALRSDGLPVACEWPQQWSHARVATKPQVVAALLSPNCNDSLAALDPAWAASTCDAPRDAGLDAASQATAANDVAGGGGCAAHGDGGTSLGGTLT